MHTTEAAPLIIGSLHSTSPTEDAKIKQRSEENALKKVARRFEAAKVAVLEARGVTESLRFDPKVMKFNVLLLIHHIILFNFSV
jgi:hypothetical protein